MITPLTIAGVRVELDCDPGADHAPAPVRHAVFRIVQESLTNVLRHAQAHTVNVSLSVREDRLLVDVSNDGPIAAPHHAAGHGLIGMRERAHAVGGTISAGTQRRGGWRVQADLPMTATTPV